MHIKRLRLPEIVDILKHHSISSQEELSKHLATRGYVTTQATLSRDLKMLKATKVSDENGKYHYILGDTGLTYGSRRNRTRLSSAKNHTSVLSIAITGNLVVIKTRNGYAAGLGYDIDTMESELILGTISGADTVFAAIREGTPRSEVYNFFCKFIPMPVMTEAASMFLSK